MAMTGFFCQDTYLAKTAKLTDEEVGRLFRALMRYHMTGESEEIDGRESVAFDFIKEDIDRDEEAYKAKCETNRRNRSSSIVKKREQSISTDKEPDRPITVDNGRTQNKIKEKENKIKIENMFARFWAAYPRKVAKPEAQKRFEKINPDEMLLQKMLDAIKRWKDTAQWQEAGGQYIPHPATWLNQRRWEDEPPRVGTGKPVPAQNYDQRSYQGEETMDDVLSRLSGRAG